MRAHSAISAVEPALKSRAAKTKPNTRREKGTGRPILPASFADLVAFASAMATSRIAVPAHLRNNPGACLAITFQALRWGADPFAVAAKSYVVEDRIAYEAQLIAAIVLAHAPLRWRPDYLYAGEGLARTCTVTAGLRDGETRDYTTPPLEAIATNSALWQDDPDQQLGYFAIRAWARRHAPDVILGLYTPDELQISKQRDPSHTNSSLRDRLAARTGSADRKSGSLELADLIGALNEAEFVPSRGTVAKTLASNRRGVRSGCSSPMGKTP